MLNVINYTLQNVNFMRYRSSYSVKQDSYWWLSGLN